MDTRKVYLEKNRSVNNVNEESFVGINLSTKSKLLPYNDVSDVLNLNSLYTEERNSCRKYRIILAVNPICTNVLFNYRTEVVRYEGSSAATLILGDVEPGPEPTYGLSVNPSSLNFTSGSSSSAITVHAENQGWTTSDICNWLTVNPNNGQSGDTQVTVSVSENSGDSGRTCVFKVNGSSSESCEVTINQAGLGYDLKVNPSALTFENIGGTQSITINGINQGWEIINIPDWITLSQTTGNTGETTIAVTVGANSDNDREFTFTVRGKEDSTEKYVNVSQTAKELDRIEVNIINAPDIPASGGSVDCNTHGVQYEVTAIYTDESRTQITSGYEVVACTGVTADSKGRNVDTGRTYVDKLYVIISYGNKQANGSIDIYQQQNELTTGTENGTTIPIISSWTEASGQYYDISVDPSEKTVSSGAGSFSVVVDANRVETVSGFTQDHWFETTTPWSSYTAMGDLKDYGQTETGTTPEYGEITYTGAHSQETPTAATTGSDKYLWLTHTLTGISYSSNTSENPRVQPVKYYVDEDRTVFATCRVVQEAGSSAMVHVTITPSSTWRVRMQDFPEESNNNIFEIKIDDSATGVTNGTGSITGRGNISNSDSSYDMNGTIQFDTLLSNVLNVDFNLKLVYYNRNAAVTYRVVGNDELSGLTGSYIVGDNTPIPFNFKIEKVVNVVTNINQSIPQRQPNLILTFNQ